MNSEVLIDVDNISKKFAKSLKRNLAYGSIELLNSFLGRKTTATKLRKTEFWALNDISFKLFAGDALGIVGINGSGKSTLLRILSGIFPPDSGQITINGSIGSLIAVGAGFHPHMTGRENIYLNGTILGMSRAEIDKNFQKIVDFADIGDFLDAPVSNYSSGMRVRLGLAIAIHGQPDILLVDEILSVGDLSFRNKSLRYMAEFRRNAKGLIFVSHDLEQIRNLCNRVIVLHESKLIYDGATHEGLVLFEEITRDIRLNTVKQEILKSNVKYTEVVPTEAIEILDLSVHKEDGTKVEKVGMKDSFKVFIDFKVSKFIESISINVPIVRDDNPDVYCISLFSDMNKKMENLAPGKYRAEVLIRDHHLNPGVYHFGTFTLRNNLTLETYNKARFDYGFKVESDGSTLEKGFINADSDWRLIKL